MVEPYWARYAGWIWRRCGGWPCLLFCVHALASLLVNVHTYCKGWQYTVQQYERDDPPPSPSVCRTKLAVDRRFAALIVWL